jgi:hypothetical protein
MYDTDFSKTHDWEFILSILEEFESINPINPHTNLRYRAEEYLDIMHEQKLNRGELRMLIAKAHKLKTHSKKEERARKNELAKRIQSAFNIHK